MDNNYVVMAERDSDKSGSYMDLINKAISFSNRERAIEGLAMVLVVFGDNTMTIKGVAKRVQDAGLGMTKEGFEKIVDEFQAIAGPFTTPSEKIDILFLHMTPPADSAPYSINNKN